MVANFKRISAGKTLRVLSLLVLAGLLSVKYVSAQEWYNSSWQFRVPVTVSNSGAALTDYQVLITLGSSFDWANTLPGGADIRFTTSDGVTAIPFWIESWTAPPSPTPSARIWVKVPSVAGNTTTDIYMYYDNSVATGAGNGFNTFEFFDDFESGISPSRWTASGGTWNTLSTTQQDGSTGYVARGITTGYQLLRSSGFTAVTGQDYITELHAQQISGTNWGLCSRVTAYNNFYGSIVYDHRDALYFYDWLPAAHPSQVAELGIITTNIWYKITVKVFGNSLQVYFNDLLRQNITNSNHPSGDIALWEQDGTAHFNNVLVRKYAVAEPSAVVGPGETATPLEVTYVKSDVTCFGGNDGSIDIEVTGGDNGYVYYWTPGGATSQDITGLTAGTYHLFVDDEAGSIGNLDVTIVQPSTIIPEYTIMNPPLCAGGTATIVISATGGTPPYSGTGSFPQSQGTSEYTITDAAGCHVTFQVTVGLAGAWFNPAWLYRKPVDVANPGGTILNDFQVRIDLDDTFDFDKTNAGGSDIRFTNSDGTEIPYWIESWDAIGRQAAIWVRVPQIPVEGSTIYLYYGNSSAASSSNGTATFKFFDDFTGDPASSGSWIGYAPHDWKYSMHMQEGALYYEILRAQNGWATGSLDSEIEQEFAYMHSQLLGSGAINGIGVTGEYVYYYGLVLSNFALGYIHFEDSNPVLAAQCYNDLIAVYNYLMTLTGWQNPTSAPDYSLALQGLSNTWKAVNDFGNTTLANEIRARIINYVSVFTQASGGWSAQSGVQDHLKRNHAVLLAYDATADASYLTKVRDNIEWLLVNRFLETNGGLTWTSPTEEGDFYECHQQWFMIAVRMLYERNNTYNYLDKSLQAWHFLTDTNYPGIDMYVHNYTNHSAFFAYRLVTFPGEIQPATFKGSYEIGAALWGMSLNYAWVSGYQSSHSSQSYDYLAMMVSQIKNSPENRGYFSSAGNWVRSLNWSESTWQPDVNLWARVGSPTAQLVEYNGNTVLSLRGGSHSDLFATVDRSFDNFVFDGRVNMTADINGTCNPEIGFHYTDLTHRYFTMMRGETQNDLFIRRVEGVTLADNAVPFNYTGNVFYNYRMVVNGNSIRLYLNDDLTMDYTDNGNILTGGFSLGNYAGTPAYYDDVRVREYAATEPVTTVGTEQPGFSWTGCVDTDWNTPGNWNAGVAPGEDKDVVITNVTLCPVLSGTVTCNSLMIEPSARLTIATDGVLTVTAGLTVNSSGTGSSGSFINNGTFNGTVTYNRFLREDANAGDKHLFSAPVGNQSVPDFLAAYAAKVEQIFTWDESAGAWTGVTTGNFISGRGYNIRQAQNSDGYFSFTGSLADSPYPGVIATSPYSLSFEDRILAYPDDPYGVTNHTLPIWASGRSWVVYGGGGWNLLGNPFTSAMNAETFIALNTTISNRFDPAYQALYIYDGINGNYKYAAASVPGFEEGGSHGSYIQAGQGFFVLANNNGIEFDFDPSMQEHNTALLLLKSSTSENPWPGLRLKVEYGNKESLTTIVYNTEMSTGLDPGYDVGQFSSGSDVEIYTALADKDNGVNFARQALPVADADKIYVPVGINTEKGGEVTFSAETVPLGNYKFWLEDRLKGTFTDLSQGSCTVTLPGKTYGTGRFYIVASSNTPTGIRNPQADEDGLRIWAYDKKVIISGEVSQRAICGIYDIRGLKIAEKRLSDGEQNIVILPPGLNGVFIVSVTDGPKVTTRKLVIL